MSTPASIKGHPLHPMLVSIPIGLWVFSFICDLLFLAYENPLWEIMAFYTLAGGEVGALIAAVPGFIDFLSLTSPRARRVATLHLALNLTIVAVVAFNLWVRWNGTESSWPIAVSGFSVAILLVSGWLGGELVHVLGVTRGETAGEMAPERAAGARRPATTRTDADPTPRTR